ncbi:MAG: 5'/3'-nucleotidase SurE [Mangrovibacterium sp.]
MERPLILISNDDGVRAKGINELAKALKEFGDIVVIAPDSTMSGMSSALTSEKPLRASLLQDEESFRIYACNGTPADCVKLAFNGLLNKTPDYVISGINHGANTSVSVIYSGTVGAALEGCIHGVPSIALSLCSHDADANFSLMLPWVKRIFIQVLQNGLPKYTCLNVNFPDGNIEGLEVCRQAEGKWENEMEQRINPRGKPYFWLTGQFNNLEVSSKDTDLFAIEKQRASVVPIKVDMTDYDFFNNLRSWDF